MNSLIPSEIYRIVADLCQNKSRFALATVLTAHGPTPSRAGAKAIVLADGTIHGTVGGGAVEAEARRQAVVAIETQQPVVFDFKLDGSDTVEAIPVCGGRMRLLVDPTARAHGEVYAVVAASEQCRQRGAVVTTIQRSTGGDTVSVSFVPVADEAAWRQLPQAVEIQAALDQRQPVMTVGQPGPTGQTDLFVDPLIPDPQLLILGAGHVGHALAHQACQIGFDVVVIDDRPEFATPDRFPDHITVRCGDVREELQRCSLSPDTYVVIVTRDHQQDAAALASCLPHPVAFIGMIGSHRKVEMIRRQFLDSGKATAADWERVYAPIGLDIGATTVPEIAASIVAQLIRVRRRGSAPRISKR